MYGDVNGKNGQGRSVRSVFSGATGNKRLCDYEIRMPVTKEGRPRFASRTDGMEAGIVTNGIKCRRL